MNYFSADLITPTKYSKANAEAGCKNDHGGRDLFIKTLQRDADRVKQIPGYSQNMKEFVVSKDGKNSSGFNCRGMVLIKWGGSIKRFFVGW